MRLCPLVHTHAHNDEEHERPLLDALGSGFCSIEADVHAVGDELLVGHDAEELKPGRTLQALYLEPLRQLVKEHGDRVYPNGPTAILLIDLKSEPKSTYPVLRKFLLDNVGAN